jgi:hypothetical protein
VSFVGREENQFRIRLINKREKERDFSLPLLVSIWEDANAREKLKRSGLCSHERRRESRSNERSYDAFCVDKSTNAHLEGVERWVWGEKEKRERVIGEEERGKRGRNKKKKWKSRQHEIIEEEDEGERRKKEREGERGKEEEKRWRWKRRKKEKERERESRYLHRGHSFHTLNRLVFRCNIQTSSLLTIYLMKRRNLDRAREEVRGERRREGEAARQVEKEFPHTLSSLHVSTSCTHSASKPVASDLSCRWNPGGEMSLEDVPDVSEYLDFCGVGARKKNSQTFHTFVW